MRRRRTFVIGFALFSILGSAYPAGVVLIELRTERKLEDPVVLTSGTWTPREIFASFEEQLAIPIEVDWEGLKPDPRFGPQGLSELWALWADEPIEFAGSELAAEARYVLRLWAFRVGGDYRIEGDRIVITKEPPEPSWTAGARELFRDAFSKHPPPSAEALTADEAVEIARQAMAGSGHDPARVRFRPHRFNGHWSVTVYGLSHWHNGHLMIDADGKYVGW